MMKKVNKDPFSNGSEHLLFESQCYTKCVNDSYWSKKLGSFVNADDKNQPKCAIQRDIVTRMCCNEPINQRTIDICRDFILHGVLCPSMKTERNKYTKQVKNQIILDL